MLEAVWMAVEAVIYNWIKRVVKFHDVMYGFCAGRGKGTAIMELKLAQDLASVEQDLLLLVFLDLRKACGNLG